MAEEPEPQPPRRRPGALRLLLTGGLDPRACALAAGVGAAVGVAPLPGLQMATCCLVAWRLRLNLPVMLCFSNISLGPMLAVWGGVCASLGRWMRAGTPPAEVYHALAEEIHAAHGLRALLGVLGTCIGDWFLGSLLLMPSVGGIAALIAWSLAAWVARLRARRAKGATPSAG